MNPLFHAISTQKEIYRRHLVDFFRGGIFFSDKSEERLDNMVSSYRTYMIKKGPGICIEHQTNKAINISLACASINGAIIRPGEVFSFWRTVGKMTKKKGYKNGRVLKNKRLVSGIGGGLCNLANAIHMSILHSPMVVVEFHKHSDALAPDEGKRVPFSSGTSVSYNYVDYRFKNTSDQPVQLLCWCEGDVLRVELRSETEFPWSYEIVEENHRFEEVSGKYYRKSRIFRNVTQRSTGALLKKELILDNVSEVMYDYGLIPKDQIKA
jgi:vancomycin resistance protein VanW